MDSISDRTIVILPICILLYIGKETEFVQLVHIYTFVYSADVWHCTWRLL